MFAFFVVVFVTAGFWHNAEAHHILGVPHYSYEDDYPQTPVLTYRVEAGDYDVKMTGYPGKISPGERCSLHLYIHRKSTSELLDTTVSMTVSRDRLLLADPVVYGPMEAHLDERIYKFHPHFDDEANYLIRVFFEADNEPWTIDLPLVVGEPESPVVMLGVGIGGFLMLLVLARAIRIKMKRRASGEPARPRKRRAGTPPLDTAAG